MADRTEQIAGLRELADALEASPDMPLPYSAGYIFASHQQQDGESQLEAMARIAKAIPGRLDKSSDDSYFYLKRKFGEIDCILTATRDEVCVRKQIGTRKTTKVEVVESREIEVDEPVYSWDCEPVLSRVAS